MTGNSKRAAASTRTMELVVAALMFLFGALVAYDSVRIGARWAEDGPQAGYFPFYVGVLICLPSAVTFIGALRSRGAARKAFVTIAQLRMVLAMLLPTIVYVAAIRYLGIYVASIAFIAFFMVWLGRYRWVKAALVSVSVAGGFFLLFELWFGVPLPKGPLEAALGLG